MSVMASASSPSLSTIVALPSPSTRFSNLPSELMEIKFNLIAHHPYHHVRPWVHESHFLKFNSQHIVLSKTCKISIQRLSVCVCGGGGRGVYVLLIFNSIFTWPNKRMEGGYSMLLRFLYVYLKQYIYFAKKCGGSPQALRCYVPVVFNWTS